MIDTARPKSNSSSTTQVFSDQLRSKRMHHPAVTDEPGHLPTAESFDQTDYLLAGQIISRIEARLPGRVRHLTVFTTENAVILTGECSTFYTKQIAQHLAMGVLEYEQLINNIDVRVAK